MRLGGQAQGHGTKTWPGRILRLGSRTMSTSHYGRSLANLAPGFVDFVRFLGFTAIKSVEVLVVDRGEATRVALWGAVRTSRSRSGARASGSAARPAAQ
jgi:hypothetical protein